MAGPRTRRDRWAFRLALGVFASLLVHAGPAALAWKLGHGKPLDVEMHVRAVDIGLETAQPGSRTPPATRVVPPVPPPPRGPSHPSNPPTSPARPEAPGAHEPTLAAHHPPPHPPEPAHEASPASPPSAPNALPSVANELGDLAPAVPRGALFTLLIRSDRVRRDPNADAVRNLLAGISDWNEMLGGSQLDPINDLDYLMLAAANPFGADGHPPDWMILARGANGSDAGLRRAVESMGGAGAANSSSAPSPVNPPALDGGTAADETASRADAGRPSFWHDESGVEMAVLDRYGARRAFMMLGNGMAAVALPEQVPALMSALARRGNGLLPHDDPRLSLLVEADGVRNTLSFNTWRGPFPMPRRAALGLYQDLAPSGPTGAVDLASTLQYDTPAESEHAREMFEYSRGRWHVMIAEQLGAAGGLNRLLAGAVASLVGINIAALESAIDALHFEAHGDQLVVRAHLSSEQVHAILAAAAMGGT